MSEVTDALSNPITLGSLITVVGAIIGILSYQRGKAKENQDATKELEHRITSLESKKECECKKEIDSVKDHISEILERVAKIETKNDVMWSAVEPAIMGVLHHPHPEYFTRDTLLEKLEAKTITEPELRQLENMFECELSNKNNSSEYMAATLLLARIRILLFDAGNLVCYKK